MVRKVYRAALRCTENTAQRCAANFQGVKLHIYLYFTAYLTKSLNYGAGDRR